jgi:hypothetical protein
METLTEKFILSLIIVTSVEAVLYILQLVYISFAQIDNYNKWMRYADRAKYIRHIIASFYFIILITALIIAMGNI